jgi:hypothetical protein
MRYRQGCWFLGIWLALASSQVCRAQSESPPEALPEGTDAGSSLLAQEPQKPKPAPGQAKPPAKPEKPAPPPTPPTPPPLSPEAIAAATPSPTGLTGEPGLGISSPLPFLGDQGPLGIGIPGIAFGMRGSPGFPPFPGQNLPKEAASTILIPSLRGFKIGEYDSPLPLCRAYVAFNYFDELNDAVNQRFGGDVHDVRVYREMFGVERTFLDGDASVGLRLPLNTLKADSGIPGVGGTDTDVGDLTVIFKYAFWRNRETGSALSAGLAVTAPTGPDAFAGQETFRTFHNTVLQPYGGYLWRSGDFYLHGFIAVDVPTDSNDVTFLFNDVGIGYYLYRAQESECGSRFLTGVVPTFEVHVNTPLNHRGVFNPDDLAGSPDIVNLTMGGTLEFGRRASLALGFITPVTGPKPFDYEIMTMFQLRCGPCGRLLK